MLLAACAMIYEFAPHTSVDPLYRLAKPPKEILWQETGHAPPTEKNQALLLQWMRERIK
jgi:hypothetical protein